MKSPFPTAYFLTLSSSQLHIISIVFKMSAIDQNSSHYNPKLRVVPRSLRLRHPTAGKLRIPPRTRFLVALPMSRRFPRRLGRTLSNTGMGASMRFFPWIQDVFLRAELLPQYYHTALFLFKLCLSWLHYNQIQ